MLKRFITEIKINLRIITGIFLGIREWYINSRKCAIISMHLETPEGRTALARAMVEPILRSREVQ